MIALKDIGWILLIVALLPLWMAIGLGIVAVIVIRQLYWWVRGNTSIVSRLPTLLKSTRRAVGRRRSGLAPAAVAMAGLPILVDAPIADR